MLILGLVKWWYINGWLDQLANVRRSFIRLSDTFSISLLLKTLFSPFRQISVGESGRGVSGRFNAFIDRLISRLIGCFMRTIMIIIGLVSLILLSIISLFRLLIWPIMPALPLVGVLLMITVGSTWIIK